MRSTSIVDNGDAIVTEIVIAGSPDQVFRALVDPRLVVQWWGGQGAGQAFRCTDFHCDLRKGGQWRSIGVDAQGHPFEISGEYLEVEPPHLLVQTWIASWAAQLKTTVRWELQAIQAGTLVRHRHSGLAVDPQLAGSFRGWPQMLGWLGAFIEKHETVNDRWPSASR